MCGIHVATGFPAKDYATADDNYRFGRNSAPLKKDFRKIGPCSSKSEVRVKCWKHLWWWVAMAMIGGALCALLTVPAQAAPAGEQPKPMGPPVSVALPKGGLF